MLTLAPAPSLDNKYTIFGRISSGLKTLEKLSHIATDGSDRYTAVFLVPFCVEFLSLDLENQLKCYALMSLMNKVCLNIYYSK